MRVYLYIYIYTRKNTSNGKIFFKYTEYNQIREWSDNETVGATDVSINR